MPDNWQPDENLKGKIIVPIGKALKVIKSIAIGNSIFSNNGISFIRQSDNFKIIVPASRQKGGEVYLDEDILDLVDNNLFEKTADKMVATFDVRTIDKMVNLIQEKLSASVTLSQSQFDIIKGEIQKKNTRKLPKIKIIKQSPATNISEFELEAAALEIELELLDFNEYAQVAGFGELTPYPMQAEQIYGVPKNLQRPPKVRMLYAKKKGEHLKITDSKDAADIFRQLIGSQITVKEHALMLLLNRANDVMGYFKIAEGGIAATIMDVRIIMSAALNVLATSIIVCHNHPSGSLKPSEPDKNITRNIKEAGKVMDISVLDHVIITTDGHFSFADEGII